MRDSRGFTFIELLGTIVILGIVSTIAIVGVGNILNSGHDKYYDEQLKQFELAGQEYFTDHKELLPTVNNASNVVCLKALINENYINKIVDYKKKDCSNTESCVTIKRISSSKYQYNGYLSCGTKQVGKKGNDRVSGDGKSTFEYLEGGKKFESTFYTNDKVTFILNLTNNDGLSGYQYVLYKKYIKNDNKPLFKEYMRSEVISAATSNSQVIKDNIIISKDSCSDGEYYVGIIPIDSSGHKKNEIKYSDSRIVIDTEKPECEVKVVGGIKGNNDWYKYNPNTNEQKLSIKLNATDKYSGIDKEGLSTSNNPTYNYLEQKQGDTTGVTWYGFVKDKAGNENICEKLLKVDTKLPTVNFSINNSTGDADFNSLYPDVSVSIGDNNNTKFILDPTEALSNSRNDYKSLPFSDKSKVFSNFIGVSTLYNRIDNFCNQANTNVGHNGADYKIYITVMDEAGNKVIDKKSYKVYKVCTKTETSGSVSCGTPPNYCDFYGKYSGSASLIDKYERTSYCGTATVQNVCTNPAISISIFEKYVNGECNNPCDINGYYVKKSYYKDYAYVNDIPVALCRDSYVRSTENIGCYVEPVAEIDDYDAECEFVDGSCNSVTGKATDKEYCYNSVNYYSGNTLCGWGIDTNSWHFSGKSDTYTCGDPKPTTKDLYLCRAGLTNIHVITSTSCNIGGCNCSMQFNRDSNTLKKVNVKVKTISGFYVLTNPMNNTCKTESKYIYAGCLTSKKDKSIDCKLSCKG